MGIGSPARLDPGEDVEWVMGVVTASRGYLTSQHIGLSSLFSKHFIGREAEDTKEYDALRLSDLSLSEDELDTLYHKHMAHRSAVILLHEWGHTMGAVHTRGHEWIMSKAYSTRELEFSETNRKIIELVLAHRIERSPPRVWLEALRAKLAGLDAAELDPDELAELTTLIDRTIPAESARAASATRPAAPPPRPAPRAERLGAALHEDFPAAAGPLAVLCEAHRLQDKLGQARRECEQAVQAYPEASLAHFALGLISLRRSRVAAARAHFRRTLQLDPDYKGAYAMLALVYRQTHEEAALAVLRRRFQARFSRIPRW